jgi:hypothetical protein
VAHFEIPVLQVADGDHDDEKDGRVRRTKAFRPATPGWVVITYTVVNSSMAPMVVMTTTNASVGVSNGTVMLRKRCQALAPSMAAAS